jgi:hypothetical protein
VHSVDEAQAFFDAGFGKALLDIAGDIDEFPAMMGVEPQFFAIGFHFATENNFYLATENLARPGAATKKVGLEYIRLSKKIVVSS